MDNEEQPEQPVTRLPYLSPKPQDYIAPWAPQEGTQPSHIDEDEE